MLQTHRYFQKDFHEIIEDYVYVNAWDEAPSANFKHYICISLQFYFFTNIYIFTIPHMRNLLSNMEMKMRLECESFFYSMRYGDLFRVGNLMVVFHRQIFNGWKCISALKEAAAAFVYLVFSTKHFPFFILTPQRNFIHFHAVRMSEKGKPFYRFTPHRQLTPASISDVSHDHS